MQNDLISEENHGIPKYKLSPNKRDNPIESLDLSYYFLEESILTQINNPESIQIVGYYNWNSILLKDINYIYLYFLDEDDFFKGKIIKIFHFIPSNNEIMKVLYDNSNDCYIKGNYLIYNYFQKNGGHIFGVVEGADFESFEGLIDGGRDKNNNYSLGKVDNTESIQLGEAPF